jgi:hypothetical protein
MRLQCLTNGHKLRHKLQLWLMRMVVGLPPLDVVRTALYRPRFFGKPFLAVMQSTMRGKSFWTVAEREMIASFVSSRNHCVF